MSYSSNPLLPKARADAVRLVVVDHLPIAIAARKSGIHRTTLWRWHKQWLLLNRHVQLTNDNRPARAAGSKFRLAACTWRIPTRSSRPHHCARAVRSAVIARIRYYRQRYRRCATIVHAYCLREGTVVSLSTVRRVLKRLGLVARKRYNKTYRPPVPRPAAARPGDLVQADTVHLWHGRKQPKTYLYTVVDVYSRWAYVEHHDHISQRLSDQFLKRAEVYAGFHFRCVQADNGSEFGASFAAGLHARNTVVRHSRVRRPNDNAFIERFNRTIQEECVTQYDSGRQSITGKVLAYLAYYNEERLHLGIQCQTPDEVLRRS